MNDMDTNFFHVKRGSEYIDYLESWWARVVYKYIKQQLTLQQHKVAILRKMFHGKRWQQNEQTPAHCRVHLWKWVSKDTAEAKTTAAFLLKNDQNLMWINKIPRLVTVSNTHSKETSGVLIHREVLKMLRRFSIEEDYIVTNFLTVLSQMFAAGCCHRPGAGLAGMDHPCDEI